MHAPLRFSLLHFLMENTGGERRATSFRFKAA